MKISVFKFKVTVLAFTLLICLGIFLPQGEVFAAENNQVNLTVSQILDTKGVSVTEANQAFTYVLEGQSQDNPMPLGTTGGIYSFTIKGEQKITLDPLVFTAVGEYQYQLRLKDSPTELKTTCDKNVYQITVYVTQTGEGLKANAVAVDEQGFKESMLTFVHSYENSYENSSENGYKSSTKTGYSTSIGIVIAINITAILLLILIEIKRSKSRD